MCRHSLNALGLVLPGRASGPISKETTDARRPRLPEDRSRRQLRGIGDQGIETAIARAAKTLRHIEWFEVGEIRGRVQDGKVTQYQVSLKVGFRVEG